ncbi:hypothetical protein [Methylobacterium sp. 37f]|uniref:hypothetical protein n=1 Tax=Methylobacterium sp. 37f TaxID=2817058 RepID=UPI001FFD30E4|nr:hypothetical protein [Methylobacterium sp. 37f]MCK2057243.1 hypothetical protein [Methylobacterium sp. 37f]
MSNPVALPDIFLAVSDMEDDIHAVRGFAEAFAIYGASASMISPRSVMVIADAFELAAERLHARWERAFKIAAEAKP